MYEYRRIYCINGKVAVKPFYKPIEAKRMAGGALAGIAQKAALIEVEVVFGSEKVSTGKAWLNPKANDLASHRDVLEFHGQRVVMVDEQYVWGTTAPWSTAVPETAVDFLPETKI